MDTMMVSKIIIIAKFDEFNLSNNNLGTLIYDQKY